MRKKKKSKFVPESACLNCGSVLNGKFCAQCGQKAFLDKSNFWHLVIEFVADYFHFDGKFFATVKAMLLKPGLITREYILGKRKSYLNPIQMYIFISAVFFILLSMVSHRFQATEDYTSTNYDTLYQQHLMVEKIRDSITQHNEADKQLGFVKDEYGFLINNKFYHLSDYEEHQKTLRHDQQDHYLVRKLYTKLLHINDKTFDANDISNLYLKAIVSTLPKVFFLLLPLFAGLLFLFFPKYPYADHAIFSLHFHIIGFILLSLLGLSYLIFNDTLMFLEFMVFLILFLTYLLLSLKKAYQESWWRTSIKFVFISGIYGGIYTLSMILLLIISLMFVSV